MSGFIKYIKFSTFKNNINLKGKYFIYLGNIGINTSSGIFNI